MRQDTCRSGEGLKQEGTGWREREARKEKERGEDTEREVCQWRGIWFNGPGVFS